MTTKYETEAMREVEEMVNLNNQEKQFIVEYFTYELENEALSAFNTLLIKNIIKKLN